MRGARSVIAGLCLAVGLTASIARADVPVPARLQAQLIAKIAAFDRNFPGRAGANALVLVIFKPGDSDSSQFAQQIAGELRTLADVGGVASTVDVIPFAGAPALAATIRDRKAAVVYLSADLDRDSSSVAGALAGGDVLTIGATGAFAEAGTVIGFDLVGGKPKIVANLGVAKAQHVDLKAEFLRLTRIVGG